MTALIDTPPPSIPSAPTAAPNQRTNPLEPTTAHRRRGPAAAAVIATLLRIPVAAGLIAAVIAHTPLPAAALLTVFVAADIADGVWARSRRVDTAVRTAIDSVIDRAAVSATMTIAGADTHNAAVMLAGLTCAAVSVACAPTALTTWRARRHVIKAPPSHRMWSLLYAAAGAFWLLDRPVAAGICALLAAIAVTACTIALSRHHARMRGRPR